MNRLFSFIFILSFSIPLVNCRKEQSVKKELVQDSVNITDSLLHSQPPTNQISGKDVFRIDDKCSGDHCLLYQMTLDMDKINNPKDFEEENGGLDAIFNITGRLLHQKNDTTLEVSVFIPMQTSIVANFTEVPLVGFKNGKPIVLTNYGPFVLSSGPFVIGESTIKVYRTSDFKLVQEAPSPNVELGEFSVDIENNGLITIHQANNHITITENGEFVPVETEVEFESWQYSLFDSNGDYIDYSDEQKTIISNLNLDPQAGQMVVTKPNFPFVAIYIKSSLL